jgi:hypothetical protein
MHWQNKISQVTPKQTSIMNEQEKNRFVQAIQHEVGVAADMRTLSKFIREQIFYVFVHDFKDDRDDCLSAEGEVCQEFIESYFDVDHNEKLLNPCLQNATEEEIRAYLKWLWKEGLKSTTKGKGNIRRDLSNEKSAVYAAISEAFKSKYGRANNERFECQRVSQPKVSLFVIHCRIGTPMCSE